MKKLMIWALVALGATLCACSNGKTDNKVAEAEAAEATVTADTTIVPEGQAGLAFGTGSNAMDMVRSFYNDRLFEDYDYLRQNCTERMLKQLADDYRNEYGDEGLAVWLFRSGAQDGPSKVHAIESIRRLDDGWFRYKAYDMGISFTRDIRIVNKNGRLLIDQVKMVY